MNCWRETEMEKPDFKSSAECQTGTRELDYRELMRCLAEGDINSASKLCTSKPDLKKLLVGCGRLSSEELQDLLTVHQTDGLSGLPLGTFFVYAGCLTIEELRAYLFLLKALKPAEQQTGWGQKLIRAGLLTADQLQAAISDRIACNITLRQAILARGFLTEMQLDKIF